MQSCAIGGNGNCIDFAFFAVANRRAQDIERCTGFGIPDAEGFVVGGGYEIAVGGIHADANDLRRVYSGFNPEDGLGGRRGGLRVDDGGQEE